MRYIGLPTRSKSLMVAGVTSMLALIHCCWETKGNVRENNESEKTYQKQSNYIWQGEGWHIGWSNCEEIKIKTVRTVSCAGCELHPWLRHLNLTAGCSTKILPAYSLSKLIATRMLGCSRKLSRRRWNQRSTTSPPTALKYGMSPYLLMKTRTFRPKPTAWGCMRRDLCYPCSRFLVSFEMWLSNIYISLSALRQVGARPDFAYLL